MEMSRQWVAVFSFRGIGIRHCQAPDDITIRRSAESGVDTWNGLLRLTAGYDTFTVWMFDEQLGWIHILSAQAGVPSPCLARQLQSVPTVYLSEAKREALRIIFDVAPTSKPTADEGVDLSAENYGG